MRARDTRGDSCRSDDAVVRAVVMALVPLVFLIGSKNRDELVSLQKMLKTILATECSTFYIRADTDKRGMTQMDTIIDDMADVATTMRFPARMYAGIRQAAIMQRTTAVELIRAAVMPYTHMADMARADGFKAITEAIARSCDTTPKTPGILTDVFQDTNLRDYHGIRVYADTTGGLTYHRILRYEGQTRRQVIADYARALWDALNNVHRDDTSGWSSDCADLCDPMRTQYAIGRVGFEKWRVFESADELDTWRKMYDTTPDASPQSVDDWAVYGWCIQNLRDIYDKRHETKDGQTDVDGQMFLYDYPDISTSSQVERWSAIVMQMCRDSGQTVDTIARWDWHFVPMVIEDHKPRKTHTKSA